MGTGASAAERKAKKAAAEAYYKEFAKLKKIDGFKRMSTKNARTLEDSIGDSASAQTKNTVKKIDRMSRDINKDESFKSSAKLYNDRYQILQDQIKNKDSVRYSVNNIPLPNIKNTKSVFGLTNNKVEMPSISSQQYTRIGQVRGDYASAITPKNNDKKGLLNNINNNYDPVKDPNAELKGMYQTKEEALAEATKRMEEYNASIENNKAQGNSPQKMKITDPNQFIGATNFQSFDVLYRNLNKAEKAAADVEALGNRVMNTRTMKMLPEYEKLNNRLKGLIKRDANNMQSSGQTSQSLVANELATGKPYTETL